MGNLKAVATELDIRDVISCFCDGCQKSVDINLAYCMDKRKFCSYKCAFRFCYDIAMQQPDELISMYCLGLFPKVFELKPYEKQKWAFQLTKHFVQELSGQ